jgi:hypothetical protein
MIHPNPLAFMGLVNKNKKNETGPIHQAVLSGSFNCCRLIASSCSGISLLFHLGSSYWRRCCCVDSVYGIAVCVPVLTRGDPAMVEFLKSDNFIKLVYVFVACFVVMVGFVNKREIIDLYKLTLSACS